MAIVNAAGKKLKLPKGSVTVTYQIHREGLSPPLAYTPLSEAWSDHLFYFSTLSFKRSGNYTVSFLVEGKDLSNVKPLVFPVTVTSKIKRCGAPDALDRLSAGKYIQSSGRFFSARKKDFDVFSEVFNGCLNPVYSELDAVKRCIATLYLALPLGSMTVSTDIMDGTNMFVQITEPTGWNDVLDQAWRETVDQADSPVILMECVLLLENYINKAWFQVRKY